MKRVLLACILFFLFNSVFGQTLVYFEDFTSTQINSVPSGWTVSPNTKVQPYSRPFPCTDDKGLLTPGVGKSAPMGLILPMATYDGSNPWVKLSFNIYVFNASSQTNCAPVVPFSCSPTLVKAYMVKSTYSGTETDIPTAGDIYAELPTYQIVLPNGNNTIVFGADAMKQSIPDGTTYRIILNFKSAENAQCGSGNTKFVLDGFYLTKTNCAVGCEPVANNDYFNAEFQTFTNLNVVKGNVYGGFALWSAQAPAGYELKSLTNFPAVQSGVDYDLNNPNLSEMTFTLLSGPTIEAYSGCSNPSPGTLTFNTNGTFTYDRGVGNGCVTRVSFTYQIAGPTGAISNTAKVIIDFQGNSSLPVTFSNFYAQRNRDKVSLKWETLSEQNNRGFNVQRNTRGVWETIAFVFSQAEGGNSATALTYDYKDPNSEKGVTQYRIQQVDMDGKATFSPIRSVKGEGQVARTVVYPNPSQDGKVSVVFEDQGAKAVVVSDMSGRIIRQYRGVLNNVLIEGLESGMYSIQVTDLSSAVSSTGKVIIKKR